MKLLDSRARYTQVTARFEVEVNDRVYHVVQVTEDYTTSYRIYCQFYKNWREECTNDPNHPTEEIIDFIESQEKPVVLAYL